jgi:hypothetical protein
VNQIVENDGSLMIVLSIYFIEGTMGKGASSASPHS